MGFSKQEYWSGLPFPSPGDLSNPGFPHYRQILYHLSHKGSPESDGKRPKRFGSTFKASLSGGQIVDPMGANALILMDSSKAFLYMPLLNQSCLSLNFTFILLWTPKFFL
ncbi:unnamed protein product [Rangifer tarandus platyrhynchus]|uniref:Uncharacterized protein n=2 Tax=Rangifer tarandus platyrhynchus TaxID=3082113 RepID=A0ABN8YFT8_RANTA|nr:unnamed protein product [Rangifer tarandus platyrhynchus]